MRLRAWVVGMVVSLVALTSACGTGDGSGGGGDAGAEAPAPTAPAGEGYPTELASAWVDSLVSPDVAIDTSYRTDDVVATVETSGLALAGSVAGPARLSTEPLAGIDPGSIGTLPEGFSDETDDPKPAEVPSMYVLTLPVEVASADGTASTIELSMELGVASNGGERPDTAVDLAPPAGTPILLIGIDPADPGALMGSGLVIGTADGGLVVGGPNAVDRTSTSGTSRFNDLRDLALAAAA